MPTQRYEPVPSTDDSIDTEVIVLSQLNHSYNSGLPTSTATSVRSLPLSETTTTSLPRYAATPSTTDSSPPSYISTDDGTPSRSQTPRPTPSTRSAYGQSLYSVAPSVMTATTSSQQCESCAAARSTITALEMRMMRLEESLGRVLLHQEGDAPDLENGEGRSKGRDHRGNCCTTFDVASPELEEVLVRRGGNCCVQIRRRNRDSKGLGHWGLEKKDRRKLIMLVALIGMMGFWAVVGMLVVFGLGRERAPASIAMTNPME